MLSVLGRISSVIAGLAPIALFFLMFVALSKGDWMLFVLIIIAITLEQIREQLIDMNSNTSHAQWDKGIWNKRP